MSGAVGGLSVRNTTVTLEKMTIVDDALITSSLVPFLTKNSKTNKNVTITTKLHLNPFIILFHLHRVVSVLFLNQFLDFSLSQQIAIYNR